MKKFQNEKQFARYVRNIGGIAYIGCERMRNELTGIDLYIEHEDYIVTGLNINSICTYFNNYPTFINDHYVFYVYFDNKTQTIVIADSIKHIDKLRRIYNYDNIKIEEYLKSKDITINSITKNILTNEIIDPFNGINDIKNKVLRHTSELFENNPINIYRVARYATIFDDYLIDNYTFISMIKLAKKLKYETSNNRLYHDFYVVLNKKSRNPRRFFDILLKLNCLHIHFKEIHDLLIQDMHDGTVYEHTMNLLKYSNNSLVRFGLLCHDFGKTKTDKSEHPHHYNHDNLGIEPITNFCNKFGFDYSYTKFALLCSTEHMRIKRIDQFKKKSKIIKFIKNNYEFIDELLEVSYIDSYYRDGSDKESVNKDFDKIYNKICCGYYSLIKNNLLTNKIHNNIKLNRRRKYTII